MATAFCPKCGAALPPGAMTCPKCGSALSPPAPAGWAPAAPAAPGWAPMAGPPEPAEAQSVRSMLHIVRILAIIFGILLFLGGLAWAALVAVAYNACNTTVNGFGVTGTYCGQALGFVLIPAIFILILGVVDIIIYMQMKSIEALVNQRQYEQAKAKTLVWMILGFILGGIILGVLLLIAYLKFDPLVNWQRSGGMTQAPVMAAPVMPAPAPTAPAAPTCPKCGRPATYVAQYGRYYCYTDQQYV